MAQEPVRKQLTRALVMGCAVACLIASSGLARAQEDDEDAPDIKFFRKVLGGLGLKGPNDEQIDYRERSPLVLPPSTEQLPPPANEAQPSAANWPTDPDVQRRKEEREAKKKQVRRYVDPNDAGRPLRPDELTPGAGTSAARRGAGGTVATNSKDDNGRPLRPDELGYKGGMFGVSGFFGSKEAETAKFVKEPERDSLTDPPPGYRTPSAAQPYGVIPDSQKPKTPASYLEKHAE